MAGFLRLNVAAQGPSERRGLHDGGKRRQSLQEVRSQAEPGNEQIKPAIRLDQTEKPTRPRFPSLRTPKSDMLLVPLLASSHMPRNDYSSEQTDLTDGRDNDRTTKLEGDSNSSAPQGRLRIAQRFIAGLTMERV